MALADVDQNRLTAAVQAFHAQGNYGVDAFRDFRQILDSPSVDAVVVATPNHWLALIAKLALDAGKDVFIETPGAHTVYEGQKLLQIAQFAQRVVHVGAQCRLNPGIREAIEWVKQGNLGNIQVARAICFRPRRSIGNVAAAVPPAGLDYEMWTGPAPLEPYGSANEHHKWRFNAWKGNGEMGNEAYHLVDLCRWALGMNRFPNQVIALGARFGEVDRGNTPNTLLVLHDYADCVLMTEIRGLPRSRQYQDRSDWNPYMDTFRGTSFGFVLECESGTLVNTTSFDSRGRVIRDFSTARITRKSNTVEVTYQGQLYEAVHVQGPYAPVENAPSPYRASLAEPSRFWTARGTSAISAFINNVHDRMRPQSSLEESRLSSALVHTAGISYQLGASASVASIRNAVAGNAVLAEALERMLAHLEQNQIDLTSAPIRLGAMLNIDPGKEQFVLNPQANALLTKSYRAPWRM